MTGLVSGLLTVVACHPCGLPCRGIWLWMSASATGAPEGAKPETVEAFATDLARLAEQASV
ncbi:hypothetical protein [Thiofilum flexile]|uniref:hypothetical protein n=1 Tax=Thiofilum flexile TaxID=125627 RepID=UPI0003786C34|nr:hypothetical protein [Thiofilum flexile]